ncbi:MAG: ferrochelatase, partial [Bdellovibrionales bacterium]|nr:ferrochelatase [Bdellovibrionales bacterium]
VEELKNMNWRPESTQYLGYFFRHPAFIRSLAQRVRTAMNQFQADHLLLSYHGLPERHLSKRSDLHDKCRFDQMCCTAWSKRNELCYRAQCFATSRALLEELNWPAAKASTAFQSRLGRAKWIGPSLKEEITRLAEAGVKRLLVSCPSFVTDCLETLEEVGMRARFTFRELGGDELHLVQSLNAHADWVGGAAALLFSFK